MAQEIIFESHSTSLDNEKEIASGPLDPDLSEKGKKQAMELGARYQDAMPDVILCSDLKRSYLTAEYAFPNTKIPILRETRLREWNYGRYNGHATKEVEKLKEDHLQAPFPEGESLAEAVDRILLCIDEVLEKYPEKKLLLIGHRATYYALEFRFHGRSLRDIVSASWKWQPGWHYIP